jgi:hypothetical protein
MRAGMPLPLMKRAARAISKLRRFLRRELVDQAELGRRAAHVEGKHPVEPRRRRRLRREHRAARGAGFHQPDRRARRGLERGHAAAGGHHQDRAAQPLGAERGLEGVEVAGHERLDVGVGDGGAEPLELPRLGADLRRERDGEVGAARRR